MSEPSPFLPDEDTPPDEPTPWGFRITLALVGLYLVYRFVELGIKAWQAITG